MASPIYRRVIVKISGEALAGRTGEQNGAADFGIQQATLERIAADLVATRALGVTLGVVVGGGNFIRGAGASQKGLPRVTGDLMGMLATVMNALALEAAIEALQVPARTMSAMAMPEICETYERRRAAAPSGAGPRAAARGRHRQPVLHHRHDGGPARRRARRAGGAQGHGRGRNLQRRSQEGPAGASATTA